ncbi:sugar ABC transporter substrate-binding protein [Kutzneria buriramensis]|uniref:D-xylose transport system substrate-binding protein n=1 Tax=Kutzneria buriramensis TaxID=1045776 RepID=A0A3E0HZH1_9PSEU|nr:substrate-binding domain-containing protein [Kutzneria buriramensis]REH51862.1 D-xylose transport system substrate-binding protein [Kutzneria buriramensis]
MRSRTLAVLAASTGLALAVTACGANSSNSGSGGSSSSNSAGNGAKVGVILPETTTSARWEGFDHPLLEKKLKDQGFDPIIQNAQGDDQKVSQLADSMLSQGVKVLILASTTGDVGAAVEKKAAAAGVPVIDYDRLNAGGSADYYVSFDNVKVGTLQGQALADSLKGKQGAQVIEIEGAATDNNALLFYQGQQQVLKPLYDAGTLKLVKSQYTDKWDNQTGGTNFENFLTANGGKVDGVLAANDGLAGAVIAVLKKNGLNGKVPVTGQDATADGLKAILRGDQYMTVFKPIEQEADAAAKLATALLKNSKSDADKIATQKVTDPKTKREVSSLLLDPQSITKDKVKDVISAGAVAKADVCTGDVAPLCAAAGIN